MASYFEAGELGSFHDQLFAKWGREVHLFRQPFSTPFATATEYWGVLKSWADDVRAGKRFAHPRWIEQGLMPADTDADLDAFCARIEASYRGDWYLYQADGVQLWQPALWHRAVEILRPILGHVGSLPPGGVMLDLFLGKYDRTPSGIHRDEGEVLAFVTRGPKRLLFWPRETFRHPWVSAERTHLQTGIWSYEQHLDSALVVEAQPGDVIYWPRSFFHLGGSPDHWSGMITMTMWWQASAQRALRFMVDSLLRVDGAPVTYPVAVDRLAESARSLPPVLAATSEKARAALDQGWDRVLAEAWARLVTGYGFLQPAARQRLRLDAAERYELRHPVAVVEIEGSPVAFACGHKIGALAGASRALVERIAGLAVGETFAVRDIAGAQGAPEAEHLLALLRAVGAVDPV